MLDMYEAVTAFCGGRNHVGPHVTGTKALIKNRGRGKWEGSEISQRLLLGLRGYIVGRALRSRESVADDVAKWSTIAQNVPPTPAFQLEEMDVEIANLQAEAESMRGGRVGCQGGRVGIGGREESSEGNPTTAHEILTTAHNLDARLTHWLATIPASWHPTILPSEQILESIRQAGLYQDYCNIYKSIFVANVLNGYAFSRITVQRVILVCLHCLGVRGREGERAGEGDMSGRESGRRGEGVGERDRVGNSDTVVGDATADLSTLQANATQTTQESADSICASIPFFLGSRTQPHKLDDKTGIQYPHLEGDTVPEGHYAAAASYAGIFLMQRLGQLLSPGLGLREGQFVWVLGQMGRVKRVYRAGV